MYQISRWLADMEFGPYSFWDQIRHVASFFLKMGRERLIQKILTSKNQVQTPTPEVYICTCSISSNPRLRLGELKIQKLTHDFPESW